MIAPVHIKCGLLFGHLRQVFGLPDVYNTRESILYGLGVATQTNNYRSTYWQRRNIRIITLSIDVFQGLGHQLNRAQHFPLRSKT